MNYQYTPYQQPAQPDKRSTPMTMAAMVMSTIALSTMCCFYLSIICGVLGILFALLSKGGETTMSSQAKTAMSISIFAIALTIILTVSSFLFVINQYGSIEAFWKAYLEMAESLTI